MRGAHPATTAALRLLDQVIEQARAEARRAERQRCPADVLDAAQWFAETWHELLMELPGSYMCSMTCTEADAVAGLYRALGRGDEADRILAGHTATDEPGDVHYEEAETDG